MQPRNIEHGIRVAVTGGRDFGFTDPEIDFVIETMRAVAKQHSGISVLIHGGARGADQRCMEWALRNDIPTKCFEAKWFREGKAAGPSRNRRMLTEGKPDLLVAFPGGRGTANCVGIARELGIEVFEAITHGSVRVKEWNP